MILGWVNFIMLNVCGVLFTYFYTLSVMPVTRAEKFGDKAWSDCMKYRSIAGIMEFLIVLNLILWIWIPIPALDWSVHSNFLVGLVIGIAIIIPCLLIMIKGVLDAGRETLQPSKETSMYQGIYKHIRHPQTVGEFPLFVALAFVINSLFLVVWTTLFILIIVPIIMHYEERDLEKRFGEPYLEYKRNTGAFFPKLRKGKDKSRKDSS
jgi:protein-S-isoprenylcysteine O-methyltransferase Ste14